MEVTSNMIVTYGDGSDIGTSCFFSMPLTLNSALNDYAWIKYDAPVSVSPLISLYCALDNVEICMFFTEEGLAAGLQIAAEKDKFLDSVLDWHIQGYTTWTVEVNGTKREYWTAQQYYMKELLELSSEERLSSYNSSKLVQGDALWVSGLYGELRNISITDTGMLEEGFVLNNCVDRMGYHYYYNMTKELPCTSKMIFPWSPLVMNNTMIGVALNLLVKREEASGEVNYFEKNTEAGIMYTVTTGPECLYAAAADPGIVTLHVYFVSDAYLVTCP